jgi:hypothetical protein
MTRQQLIEQILRQVYGTQPTDDSTITPNLVNLYINQGIGVAVKQNYNEANQLEGVGYVNNSFYSTFKGIPITKDDGFLWKLTLPSVPYGVAKNEGLSSVVLKENNSNISLPVVFLSVNQVTYYQSMPQIPNKTLAYYQGNTVFISSVNLLNQYTATVTLISAGDSNDLSSTLNVPDDYMPIIIEYAAKMLSASRAQIQDNVNDGTDAIRSV